MSYDEKLALQIAEALNGIENISQKTMFGGICFLLNGNMLCGVIKNRFVARVGIEEYEKLLRLPYTAPMDFTGKPMKGIIYVLPEGLKATASIKKWVEKSLDYVQTLPKKKKKRLPNRAKSSPARLH